MTWLALACGSASDDALRVPASGGTANSGSGGDGGAAFSTGGTGGMPTGGHAGSGAVDDVVCDSDRDCTPFGKLCNLTTSHCADCNRDVDCDGGLVCRGGVCMETYPCLNSLDCVSAPDGRTICDPLSGECVQCTAATDCPPNNDCVAARCMPFTPCVNSLDCPDGVCDPSSGRCVGCISDADCAPGGSCVEQTCQGGTCAPRTCAGLCGTVTDGCGGQLDCGACDAHCANGLKDADEAGVDCGGASCPACGTAGVWERCLSDSECAGGRICSKELQEELYPGRWGFCTLPCSASEECTDPSPPGGEASVCVVVPYCLLECTTTGVCPDGMECVQGVAFLASYCRHPLIE